MPRVSGSSAPAQYLRLVANTTALSLPHHNCYTQEYVFNSVQNVSKYFKPQSRFHMFHLSVPNPMCFRVTHTHKKSKFGMSVKHNLKKVTIFHDFF